MDTICPDSSIRYSIPEMKTNGKHIALWIPALLLWAAPAVFPQTPKAVPAEYYGETGCSHCDQFAGKILPAAEARTGVDVALRVFDILSADGYERCRMRLAELGYGFTAFPVLVIGNNAYQGSSAVEENLLTELSHYAQEGEFRPRLSEGPGKSGGELRMEALPILLAGLVDGSRGRIAAAGLSFVLGVFLSYFLIGLGLFGLLREGSRLAGFRLALRLAVTCMTAAYCFLTVRDLRLLRAGRSSEMKLQLPPELKRRVHSAIRGGADAAFLPLGALVSGLLVAALELACTGQVYFPAIAYMVRTDRSFLGVGSLALYNAAFVAPLVAVLLLVFLGMSQEAIRFFFRRHIAAAKAALAAVFVLMSVLVWLV